MNRRNFLKSAGGVLAVLTLCPSALLPKNEWHINGIRIEPGRALILIEQTDAKRNGIYRVSKGTWKK